MGGACTEVSGKARLLPRSLQRGSPRRWSLLRDQSPLITQSGLFPEPGSHSHVDFLCHPFPTSLAQRGREEAIGSPE